MLPTLTPQPTATPEPTVLLAHTPVPPPGPVQDLRVTDVTEDSITVQWEPSANSDAVPVDGYEVTRDVSLGPDEHSFVLERTFTGEGLRAGTEYRYRVRAIGAGGIEGAETGIEESTLESPTPEPTRTPQPTIVAVAPTPAPTATDTPRLTATPSATTSPAATPTPVPSATPEPTWTPMPAPTAAATLTVTPSPTLAATWRGLLVADEDRCSPYSSGEYSYSPTV